MGVYLPNMEMPKEGSWKTVRIYPDGTCAIPNWQGDCTFIKDTKAIPVPPHGDLIDRDVLLSEYPEPSNYLGTDGVVFHITGIRASIECAETIMPASEEGE